MNEPGDTFFIHDHLRWHPSKFEEIYFLPKQFYSGELFKFFRRKCRFDYSKYLPYWNSPCRFSADRGEDSIIFINNRLAQHARTPGPLLEKQLIRQWPDRKLRAPD